MKSELVMPSGRESYPDLVPPLIPEVPPLAPPPCPRGAGLSVRPVTTSRRWAGWAATNWQNSSPVMKSGPGKVAGAFGPLAKMPSIGPIPRRGSSMDSH